MTSPADPEDLSVHMRDCALHSMYVNRSMNVSAVSALTCMGYMWPLCALFSNSLILKRTLTPPHHHV